MKDKTQYTLDMYFLIVMAICLFRAWTPPLLSFEFWWDTELQTKRKTFFNWNWGIFVFFIIINRRTYLSYTHVHLPSNRVVGTWGCLGAGGVISPPPQILQIVSTQGWGSDYAHHISTPHPLMDFQTFLRPCFKSCTRKWIHWSFSPFAYLPFCLIHMPFFT